MWTPLKKKKKKYHPSLPWLSDAIKRGLEELRGNERTPNCLLFLGTPSSPPQVYCSGASDHRPKNCFHLSPRRGWWWWWRWRWERGGGNYSSIVGGCSRIYVEVRRWDEPPPPQRSTGTFLGRKKLLCFGPSVVPVSILFRLRDLFLFPLKTIQYYSGTTILYYRRHYLTL